MFPVAHDTASSVNLGGDPPPPTGSNAAYRLLRAEEASRHKSVIRQRLREARFPEIKTLDTFDFAAADGVNATRIHTLARVE